MQIQHHHPEKPVHVRSYYRHRFGRWETVIEHSRRWPRS